MAEAWIKMRTNLATHPKVVAMSVDIGVHVSSIIGACFVLWSIADEHSVSGRLPGYTFDTIDALVGLKGFCAAASSPRVVWLASDERGVVLPRFGVHNGNSAKRRAAKAKSAAKNRHNGVHSVDNVVHAASTKRPPTAEQEQQQRADKSKRREEASSNAAAAPDSQREVLCSLLLGLRHHGATVFTPAAAAAIAAHRNVSRMQIAWAVERMNALPENKAFKSGPEAYLRGLLENHKPPQGWIVKYQRAELAKLAAKPDGGAA